MNQTSLEVLINEIGGAQLTFNGSQYPSILSPENVHFLAIVRQWQVATIRQEQGLKGVSASLKGHRELASKRIT